MILTYLLFGATTLRTDVLPTAVGVLMLLEVAAFLLVATRLVPPFTIDLLHTGVNLGIGGLLATRGTDRAGTDVPADSTARPASGPGSSDRRSRDAPHSPPPSASSAVSPAVPAGRRFPTPTSSRGRIGT